MSFEATNLARKAAASGVLRTGESYMLLLLADHVHPDSWECWPSQQRLALETGQGTRTVERQIARLRELGLIHTENLYGPGRGRVGLRYCLNKDAMSKLADIGEDRVEALKKGTRRPGTEGARKSEDREITRPANMAGKSENREITRPANMAGKSESREITRPANMAGKATHPPITTDSPANHDIRPYKDRARTNHQESSVSQSVRLSGPVRAGETDGWTDGPMAEHGPDVAEVSAAPSTSPSEPEGRQEREHRGVDLDALVERVPAASGLDEAQLRLIIQVVLARASGPVRNPVAFVAKSLAHEFHELVSITAQHVQAPSAPSAGAGGGQVRQLPAREPVPCTNPDHAGYGADVLADCPHCRIEAKTAQVAREARG